MVRKSEKATHIQYDKIRVYSPEQQRSKYIYVTADGYAYLNYGEWKRDNLFILGKKTWNEVQLLQEFLLDTHADEKLLKSPIHTFELCKDICLEDMKKPDLMSFAEKSYSSLPPNYKRHPFGESYIGAATYSGKKELVIYDKKFKKYLFPENCVRFELRLSNNATIKKTFGHELYLEDLLIEEKYTVLKEKFYEEWKYLISFCQEAHM
jgi:hypothetical protein